MSVENNNSISGGLNLIEKKFPELSKKSIENIREYTELLLNERKVRNIVGPRDLKTIVNEHILPSIELSFIIREEKGIDIGTGAGLPGLVVALSSPQKEITLVEPKKSRVNFLNKVKNELNLDRLIIINSRAELAGRDSNIRERYGFGLCRAVADLKISSELVLPFLSRGGIYYAQRGEDTDEEISSAKSVISKLGGKILKVRKDNIILIQKIEDTPGRYPRSWNKISK